MYISTYYIFGDILLGRLYHIAQRIYLFNKPKLMNRDILGMCKSMDINPESLIFIACKSNPRCVGDLFFYIKPIVYVSRYEINFILAHELSHIKLHYNVKMIAVILISYFCVFFISKTNLQFVIMYLFIMNTIVIYATRYFEKKADINACKHCTKDEIIQFISYLNDEKCDSLLASVTYFFDGHPHPDVRIRYLKQEIHKRQ